MADMNSMANLYGNIASAGALGGGISGIGSYLFGDPSKPYEDASKVLDQYLPQAQEYQQPFYEAGKAAIPQYQSWLQSMQDPSGFINKLMGGYQESPYAKFQQQQMRRSAGNMASASGLEGSTPLMDFIMNQSGKISSGDMQNWLQRVLGVNQQYGAGEAGLVGAGQTSANALSKMLGDFAGEKANLKYGAGAAEQGGLGEMMGGLGNLAMFAML